MRREKPKGVRVIVCGGRDFTDDAMLSRVLWHVHNKRCIAELIHGGQKGAERLASYWAFHHGIHRVELRADVRKYGRTKAPMIRNRQMLDLQPDGVIAFPGGPDARVMVQQAKSRGLPVLMADVVNARIEAKWAALAEQVRSASGQPSPERASPPAETLNGN